MGSCRFQGFLFQFGTMASLFFNASLAAVYLLMVQWNWSKRRLVQVFRPLGILFWIISFGCALALLLLDLYHPVGPICWINSPVIPKYCQDLTAEEVLEQSECQDPADVTPILIGMQVLPTWICIFLDTIIMCVIYSKTMRLEQSASTSFKDSTLTRPPIDSETAEVHTGDNEDIVSTTGPTQTVRSSSSVASKVVATQGMWYIAGFFLTFGLNFVAVLVFMVSGSWNARLDRAAYFFVALQGFWNFLIFSRGRKDMKTVLGRKLKRLLWENSCGYRSKCLRNKWAPPQMQPKGDVLVECHRVLPGSGPPSEKDKVPEALQDCCDDDVELDEENPSRDMDSGGYVDTIEPSCLTLDSAWSTLATPQAKRDAVQKNEDALISAGPNTHPVLPYIDTLIINQVDEVKEVSSENIRGSKKEKLGMRLVCSFLNLNGWSLGTHSLVSELGASGISGTDELFEAEQKYPHDVSPCKPLRLASVAENSDATFQDQAIRKDGSDPPSKPERIESIAEASSEACASRHKKEKANDPPSKPVRIVSDANL